MPGYRKVPGVIYARRYRVLEGTSGYSTVYEFASTAVPESPEWKEQQQHSSPNSPRMRQAMTHAPGSAGVYVRVNPIKSGVCSSRPEGNLGFSKSSGHPTCGIGVRASSENA